MLGWNVGNDSVVHVTYADALAMPDRAPIAGSSAYAVVQTFASGYPEGSHALLAAVLAFSRDPLTSFNPVLAVMMAFAAFPAYWLIRRQLASAPLAGIGAAGAAGGYLQFGFYSQGFMPQLAVTALLFGALGLGYEALAGASLALAAMAGVTAAASVIVYSAAVGVYLAPAALLALVALVVIRGHAAPQAHRSCPRWRSEQARSPSLPELSRTLDLARTAAGAAGDPTASSAIAAISRARSILSPCSACGSAPTTAFRFCTSARRTSRWSPSSCSRRWRSSSRSGGGGSRFRPSSRRSGSGLVYVSSNSSIYYTAKAYQVASFPIACAVVAGAAL